MQTTLKWVNARTKQPEEWTPVLAIDDYGYYWVAEYHGGKWSVAGYRSAFIYNGKTILKDGKLAPGEEPLTDEKKPGRLELIRASDVAKLEDVEWEKGYLISTVVCWAELPNEDYIYDWKNERLLH